MVNERHTRLLEDVLCGSRAEARTITYYYSIISAYQPCKLRGKSYGTQLTAVKELKDVNRICLLKMFILDTPTKNNYSFFKLSCSSASHVS